ncbi:efflux RND transporter periplasmic adaptor subunit [Foetidibacter luteolus]|uniref:efflux RND transporter periplasmic adaptor subunit n=1 Tax=Foetidibacter luteolus TaxID=2608880 RepID=UPI00129BBB06|nr:efflux RND transporter periplasmic adaptor subunit [Foetidibacter luteolus]
MKAINIFPGLVLLLLCFASCKEPEPAPEEKKQFCLSDTMQHMIAIDSVRMCRIDDEIQLSGEVSFDENKVVKIFPRSSGQVVECKVTLGDKVQAGQVLAIIKSADVAGNYADMSSADADVAIAKRQMDNQESLYKGGIASEREYTEAKQNYGKALAAKRKIESLININGGRGAQPGGNYIITSPITGYIVEKKVNAGNFIRQDESDNLFTISDLKEVWVMANVFETDIPRVKDGMPVKVTTLAYPDKVFTGTVDKSSEVLDPVNKVMKVRVRLSNDALVLKPEMFTTVTVTNEQEGSALCVPSGGIVEESGKTYLVIYKNNCDLSVKEVSVLKVVGDKTYLSDGVQAGEKIITRNALLIYDEFTDN